MPPLAVFSEIAARPLFSPTRRPPPPPEEAPAAEEAPVERGQFALRGVALAGENRELTLIIGKCLTGVKLAHGPEPAMPAIEQRVVRNGREHHSAHSALAHLLR